MLQLCFFLEGGGGRCYLVSLIRKAVGQFIIEYFVVIMKFIFRFISRITTEVRVLEFRALVQLCYHSDNLLELF